MFSFSQGKVQKLKDRQFGRVQLFVPHKNPSAVIGNIAANIVMGSTGHKNVVTFHTFPESPIKHYKHHSIVRAYQGDTFFWGLAPQPGDKIIFSFEVFCDKSN